MPSAQRFISAVEENVNVEVREIGALTGPPTPWRLPSPAWMAWVWAPRGRVAEFGEALADLFFVDLSGGAVFMMAPFCAVRGGRTKHQFGGSLAGMRGEIRAPADTY